jgi:hypothetical protein
MFSQVPIVGMRVDTESTVDDLCGMPRVRLGLFQPYLISYIDGKLSRGGELPGQFEQGDRKALTFTHAEGQFVLHYPDAIVRYEGAPYAGHFGFQLARGGQAYVYHIVPT